MKCKKPIVMIALCMLTMSGCVLTDKDQDKNILASLTKQQQLTLLAMLENYDANQQAIETWKAKAPSVARLVEVENDLRMLIVQLTSLHDQQQTPAEPEEVVPEQATATTAAVAVPPTPQPEPEPEPQQLAQPASSEAPEPLDTMQGYTVQLAAVNSMAHLTAYWQRISREHQGVFGAELAFYEHVDNARGDSLYRLKLGKFNSKAEAISFCRDLASSGVKCFVTNNMSGSPLLL